MIDAVNVAAQTVNVNNPVIFGATRIKTGCTVRHEQGSGRFVLTKPGVYRVTFNANISTTDAGTAILGVTQDGEAITGASINATTIAGASLPVSVTTLVRVYCCDSSVSVANLSTVAINVTDANIIIDRLC